MVALSILLAFVALSWTQREQILDTQPITLDQLLSVPLDTSTIRIRNFWATWCKPCIAELPIFARLARKGLMVELISIDDVSDSTRVQSFWRRRGFTGVKVYHLRQRLTHREIDAIASEWSGSIPMTLIERGTKRIVHEGELTETELRRIIELIKRHP